MPRAGSNTMTTAYTHSCGKKHRSIEGLLLFQQMMGAGSGSYTGPFLRIMFGRITN
jgi:hypothetical protein